MKENKFVPQKKREDELVEFQPEIKKLIAKSNKEKYIFPKSDEILKNINLLYFLDEKSHENISYISSKYLVSEFSLNYLKLINDIIEKKYKIPQLTLEDFTNNDRVKIVKNETAKLENESMIKWLKEDCLVELKNTIDNIEIKNIDKLVKFGHIVKLSENEMDSIDKIEDINIYDYYYRFLDRLGNLEQKHKKGNISCKVSMRKTSKDEDTEIRFDIRSDPSETMSFENVVSICLEKGKEMINTDA